MKEFLSRKGVSFIDRNVSDDPQAFDELKSKGYARVPVTWINGLIIVGYDPQQLEAALRGE